MTLTVKVKFHTYKATGDIPMMHITAKYERESNRNYRADNPVFASLTVSIPNDSEGQGQIHHRQSHLKSTCYAL